MKFLTKIRLIIKFSIYYLFGISFGYIFYPRWIFRGKYFDKPWYVGWAWVFNCFFYQKILGINRHVKWPVSFKNCWIGFNAVILPGVILGDNTIVGAGSIVTKSFESGHCVIAGNPAKIIKYI